MYNINRRKFLGYFGCSCCSLILPSCSTVPITERKQLSIKITKELLSNNGWSEQLNYFEKHKKKDDLADAFLQSLWYISNIK